MDDYRAVAVSRVGDDPREWIDEAVLRRIVDASWTAECPYSDVETLVEKLEALFPFLVDVARERTCTDHGSVASECGVHAARQGRVLRLLGLHEDQLDRPLLPAVVTRAGEDTPGEEYFRLVEAAPGQPDAVPSNPAERRWIWQTHRADVYREWGLNEPSRRPGDRSATAP